MTNLSTLVDPLKAALNAPGGAYFVDDDNDAWVARLANAFWLIRLKRFFTEWRIDEDSEIIPVVEGGEDMPGELQQLVVMMARITAIQNKILELNTHFRAKSGEQEFETDKAATPLVQLLKDATAELETLRADLVATPLARTGVAVVDMIAVRAGTGAWVGA